MHGATAAPSVKTMVDVSSQWPACRVTPYIDIMPAFYGTDTKYAVKSVKLLHKLEFMIVITVITDQGTKGRHKI